MIGKWYAQRRTRYAAAVLALGACAFAVAAAAGAVMRDDLLRDVAVPRAARRIITLLPSLTETVCALGACDRLVATGSFDDWPAQVKSLPKLGGLDDVGIEQIVRLKPDLVLLSTSQRISDRLGELGIPAFALETDRYSDIGRSVTIIGRLLGLPGRAAALNARIHSAVRRVSEQAIAARHGAGASVYFEVDPGPYAAGPQSYIGELLEKLGVRNIVAPAMGPFPLLNPEYVVRKNPDVIFISRADAAHLAERPGWDRIRAVREHRICTFPSGVRDTIVRPGPRVADGMRALADCLRRVAP